MLKNLIFPKPNRYSQKKAGVGKFYWTLCGCEKGVVLFGSSSQNPGENYPTNSGIQNLTFLNFLQIHKELNAMKSAFFGIFAILATTASSAQMHEAGKHERGRHEVLRRHEEGEEHERIGRHERSGKRHEAGRRHEVRRHQYLALDSLNPLQTAQLQSGDWTAVLPESIRGIASKLLGKETTSTSGLTLQNTDAASTTLPFPSNNFNFGH